ncbi:MAG: fumarylacetoacetate hydrolase family protein [Lachnospiraceae bacterium]|nr:fumarylacetoacetate hydrolase family protein [Lachnospiraceae bacterium]
MKLATFIYGGEELVGIVADQVIPLRDYSSMEDLIRKGLPDDIPEERIPADEVKFLSPIPRPAHDVICLGMNFADHTTEAARFHPTMVRENYAVYFSKRVNLAVPDKGIVDSHENVTQKVDYEAEVAVIIGKDAYQVAAKDAQEYVFGYTLLNDISAREVQTRHKQFYLGKSLDGFTPIGPWIVTADEFAFPPMIPVRSYVNGELRQNGNTSQWIYGIEDVIEDLSAGMTLEAGTIISMGTPAGVGMGFDPPKFLKKGDVVICEADGIGTLTNTIG